MWRLVLFGLWGCGRINFGDGASGLDPDAVTEMAGDADPLRAGLLVHLTMDDSPEDGTLTDASGAGRDAICSVGATCPTPITGRVGNAVRFFGERCARVSHTPELLTTSGYTVAAWLYVDVDTDQVAFAKPYGTGDLDAWSLVAWGTGSALGTGTCMESLNPPETGHEVACGPQLPLDRWVHTALRWTGQAKSLFLDGTKVGELMPATTSAIDAHDVMVGCDENMGSQVFYFQGRIDELRLYGRALDDAEIMALAEP